MSEPPGFSPDEAQPPHTEVALTPAGEDGHERVSQAIMFTDIENSVNLAGTLGADRYAKLLTRHGDLFYEALSIVAAAKIEKHTGDGFMARFERSSEAVGVALRFQWLLRHEEWGIGHPLKVRVGIHEGEILLIPTVREMPGTIGTAVNLAARVMGMADGGQVLLTRAVFDDARQLVTAIPGVPAEEQAALGWEAHGAYLVKGIEGPVEVFEVGERGHAPFRQPRNGPGAERSVSAEEETTLGWRPAAELEVPKRPGWRLVRSLGQGGFGEVWLAENRATREVRVFKFCFDVVRLRSFKREVALFRLIQEALGPRRDITTLYEIQLETSPFFLESEYCAGGTLDEWLEGKMLDGEVPLGGRLKIVALIARALAAAHSVGIIHKDVKPSNIFIEELPDGTARPRLADFGIGELAQHPETDGASFNITGLTLTAEQTHTGTPMYRAPEYLVGVRPSVPGDIYSLGVLLYQVVVVDFHRPIGDGWRRDVPDELLAEIIAACVDVQPKRRPSSATQVAEQLETLDQRRAELSVREAEARDKLALEEKVRTQRRKIRQGLIVAAFAAVVIAALLVAAFFLQRSRNEAVDHASAIANQREREQDQRYREDMTAAIMNIDHWRGEAVRELVERHRPGLGQRDRRGWEWWLANTALNPRHDFLQVSALALRALAVSPDEMSVAVAGDGDQISIRSCDTFDEIDSWTVGPVRSLAWKGGMLAIGLASGEVVLREVATKRDHRRWPAHRGAVTALAWNPVRDELTTGGEDGAITCWQSDGTPLKSPLHKQGPVLSLNWEANGERLATVLGNPARLIAADPDRFDHEYPLEMPGTVVAWRPGANEVAVAMKGYPMCSFDLYHADNTFALESQFTPGASAFAWAPDGGRIAVGGIDGKIVVVDAHNPREMRPALYGHDHRVTGLHWLSRERLLSIGEDGFLRAWDDLQRPAHTYSIDFPAALSAAQWHPSDRQLAVLVAGDDVQVVDNSRRTIWRNPLPPPTDGHLALTGGRLAWSPDGRWLAAVCLHRGLVAWRMQDGERFLPPGLEDASDVRWLDDNRTMLVRTARGWLRVALEGGASVPIADQDTVWVNELGNGLFGKVGTIGNVFYFTVGSIGATPLLKIRLPKELGVVHTCALNADRTLLAIGGETGALVWVDTRSGALTQPVRMHSSAIQALAWLPNGSRLATASSDGTCRVIDVARVVETLVVEHQLAAEIVSAGWSADGRSLMLASGPSRQMKIYEIADLEGQATTSRAASLLAAIKQHPDEESGWNTLAEALQTSKDEHAPILRAAAKLAAQARFTPLDSEKVAGAEPATTWEGAELTLPVRVAQACALERWEEVATLSIGSRSPGAASWLALARAEALAHLGRKQEAEKANSEAWQHWRRHHGARDFTAANLTGNGKSSIDLNHWATARLQDDWVFEDYRGNENNNLLTLPPVVKHDGIEFQCGDFILLGGKTHRVTTGLMLPRSTGWIPLNAASHKISCMIAACNMLEPEPCMDTCVGSIFLLRSNGGVVRIPLVFGRNIWRWWISEEPKFFNPPEEAIAWPGNNARAPSFGHKLGLYRLNWTAENDEAPVVAISIVSTMRQPAPLLMSVDAQP